MALKEDDIKDLGLEIGEEIKPMAVGDCGRYESPGCFVDCQGKNETGGCTHQAESCSWICQTCEAEQGCQTTCEKSCQNCEGRCQSKCEKSSQCNNCEYDCQTNYQRRCGDNCQDTCEKSCQTTCQSSCQNTCERSCQSAAQKNSAPNAPTSVSAPSNVKGGETVVVSWGAATDRDGNLTGYILEKKTDNASFNQIYKGSSRSLSDTITVGSNTVQYRVKAYDSYGKESSYAMSNIITVTNNSAPEISGRDSDLGGKKAPFKISLSVSDKDSDTVNVICKLNGSIVKTINNIKLDTNYEIEIDATRFNALVLNARNEIEISATDSKATSYRRYTFSRVNSAPEITIEKAIFGEQDKPFSFKYKVTDAENDKCSVRILYGSKVLYFKKDVELGKEQTYTFSKLDFAKIPAGEISIKIETTDVNDGTSSKLITFNKTISGCGYIFKKDTAAKATQSIISVSRKIDEKSTFKAYVCNNANDTNPTWEEVTGMMEKIYTIKNTTKTAAKWSFGLKVEVIRGKDAGDSYLSAIGYSYR